jgi:hypothetical protein
LRTSDRDDDAGIMARMDDLVLEVERVGAKSSLTEKD